MYYTLEPGAEALSRPPEKKQEFIGYLTLSELQRDAILLDIDTEVLELAKEKTLHNTINTWDDYSFGMLSLPDVERVFEKKDLIGIFIDREKLLIIDLQDEDHSTKKAFVQAFKSTARNLSIARVFFLFIKELTKGHFMHYKSFQRIIGELERSVWQAQDKSKDVEHSISSMSHDLLVLHSYYEELSDLLNELEENENEIFDDEELGYIRSLISRIDHYSANMKFLREYLALVRESYQAQLDLRMNEIMKIFTVLAAVFLPLTLLVGWYGMNFKNMPELDHPFGYPGVIFASGLITVGILYYFKRKKLL